MPMNSKKATASKSDIDLTPKPTIGGEVLSSVLPHPKTNAKGQIWCPLAKEGAGD